VYLRSNRVYGIQDGVHHDDGHSNGRQRYGIRFRDIAGRDIRHGNEVLAKESMPLPISPGLFGARFMKRSSMGKRPAGTERLEKDSIEMKT